MRLNVALQLVQLMYINGLADAVASDKYGGHIFEETSVADQDGKMVSRGTAARDL